MRCRIKWDRLLSPPGLVTCIAGNASGRLYVGTPAGLHLSGGQSDRWLLSRGDGAPRLIEAVAVHGRTPADDLILVGTAFGVSVSTDSGSTWSTGLDMPGVVQVGIAVDELDCVLVAATSGDGVFMASSEGKWASANAGLMSLRIFDLFVSPNFSSDRRAIAATADGLYTTKNGFQTWSRVDEPEDFDDLVTVLDGCATNANVVLVSGTQGGVVRRSSDFGETWTELTKSRDGPTKSITVARRDGSRVAAVVGGSVLTSKNGGRSWTAATPTAAPTTIFCTDCGPWPPVIAGTATAGLALDIDADPDARSHPNVEGYLPLSVGPGTGGGLVVGGVGGVVLCVHTRKAGYRTHRLPNVEDVVSSVGPFGFLASSSGVFRLEGETIVRVGPALDATVDVAPDIEGEAKIVYAVTQGGDLFCRAEDGDWSKVLTPFGRVTNIGLSLSRSGDLRLAVLVRLPGGRQTEFWLSSDRGGTWDRRLRHSGEPVAVLAPSAGHDEWIVVTNESVLVAHEADAWAAGSSKWRQSFIAEPDEPIVAAATATSASDRAILVASTGRISISLDDGRTYFCASEDLEKQAFVTASLVAGGGGSLHVMAANVSGHLYLGELRVPIGFQRPPNGHPASLSLPR